MNPNPEVSLLLGENDQSEVTDTDCHLPETEETIKLDNTMKAKDKKQKTVALIVISFVLLVIVLLVLFIVFRSKANSSKIKPISNLELTKDPGYSLKSVVADNSWINATAAIHTPSSFDSVSNPSVKYINFTSRLLRQNHFEIRMIDAENSRFEVPDEYPFPGYSEPYEQIRWNKSRGKLYHPTNVDDDFSFAITRRETNETLFSMNSTLIYTKFYLELTSELPRGYLYGLGERAGPFQLRTGTYTLWNKDAPFMLDHGIQGSQTYGYHPVYLIREESGNFSLVFLKISNAMDAIIQSDQKRITFKIAGGGIFDIHVLLGGANPENLIKNYHEYIRKWSMPPFWSLGWHQCRWGYTTLDVVESVLNNYTAFQLPLDVIWSDIDYMRDYVDFTIDETRFPVKRFNEVLQKYQKRWVPIIDAGIGLKNDTYAVQKIEDLDIGIKYATSDDILVGSVWPGDVYWVDFWHPGSEDFWGEMLELLYQQVNFSGIWLDMNELSNFCNGNCDPSIPVFAELPYTPGGVDLSTKTIDVGARHYQGLTELNVHTFNGFVESKATYEYLKTKSPLPFILSRSTTYGSGQFASHWTGDNAATVDFLKYSISGILAFNIYGIPHTGSDICGFSGDTTEMLCARWMQLGSWYPFARNHHEIGGIMQEPYAWGANSTVLLTSQAALRYRYAHLRYYYTQFLEANGTGTVFRPVFFEWPQDEMLYNSEYGYSERQFLIGDALMVCPSLNLTEIDEFDSYFPAGRWYDYKEGVLILSDNNDGSIVTIQSKLGESSPVYLRGGKVVFAEFSSASNVSRSDDLPNKFTMTVGLSKTSDGEYYASGNIMGSKDISDETLVNECILKSCIIETEVNGDNSQLTISFASRAGTSILIDEIRVWGLDFTGTESHLDSSSSNMQVTVEVNEQSEENYIPLIREDGRLELKDVLIQVEEKTTIYFRFSISK